MVAQGVDVINHSLTHYWSGPGDGTFTSTDANNILKAIDTAVAGGVVWVNAAGDRANGQSWFGATASDTASSHKQKWSGADTTNAITSHDGDPINVDLRWNNPWPGANKNIDLTVDVRGTVQTDATDQSGGAATPPAHLNVDPAAANTAFHAEATGLNDTGTAANWIQLSIDNGTLEHSTKKTSLAAEAESDNPGMLAVGATHWSKPSTIEPFSAQGPTPDIDGAGTNSVARVKPDVVGVDCAWTSTSTKTAYPSGKVCWFKGTAAAHISGLTALVRERYPNYTPTQVANYIKLHANAQQEPAAPNNVWGHGVAKLPDPFNRCDPVTVTNYQEFFANLEDGNCVGNGGKLEHFYTFTLTASTLVNVYMEKEGGELDSLLCLYRDVPARGVSDANKVGCDDNSQSAVDARYRGTQPPGSYMIQATTKFDPNESGNLGKGPYKLTVAQDTGAPGLALSRPAPTTPTRLRSS